METVLLLILTHTVCAVGGFIACYIWGVKAMRKVNLGQPK